MGTELFEAMRAADPHTPQALAAFDRIVGAPEAPDFYEHSVRLTVRSSYRLTYYFDVHRRGAGTAQAAGDRFLELAGELQLTVPPPLATFVQSRARAAAEVLQVVLGVDAPTDGDGVRGKYYLVFRGNPRDCVTELLDAVRLAATPGADPENVYILGVDVTRAGVDDAKLYFRLQPRLVPKLLDDPPAVAGLLGASRDVVFQQCLRRPDRRQLYLHVRSAPVLSGWLAQHGFEEILQRARSINAHLPTSHIDPWIISFAYDRRRLEAGTVYFHLASD